MANLVILIILACLFVYLWIKTESFLGAAFVVVILGALAGHFFGFDWKEAKTKFQEIAAEVESGEMDEKIARMEKRFEEKVAEFDRVHGAPGTCEDGEVGDCVKEEDDGVGFSVKIQIDQRSGAQIAADNLAAREEVRVVDVLRELDLVPEHITGFIREVTYAKLYKVDGRYTLVTPAHGTFEPDVFLMHSDGRLFVGKDRRVWPVGAD